MTSSAVGGCCPKFNNESHSTPLFVHRIWEKFPWLWHCFKVHNRSSVLVGHDATLWLLTSSFPVRPSVNREDVDQLWGIGNKFEEYHCGFLRTSCCYILGLTSWGFFSPKSKSHATPLRSPIAELKSFAGNMWPLEPPNYNLGTVNYGYSYETADASVTGIVVWYIKRLAIMIPHKFAMCVASIMIKKRIKITWGMPRQLCDLFF